MARKLTVIDNIIPVLLERAVLSPPVLVMGYNKPDDGGGGLFRWVPCDTTPPDGGMVFASTAHGANGRWRRVVDVGYVSVKWFGATGDRTTDDGPAITRAIAYATGSDDPATHPRAARAAVYLPAGIYGVNAANGAAGLLIRSVQGFRLFGDGPDISVLWVGDGLSLDSLLEIDGSANGIFENFSLQCRDATDPTAGYADKMLYLHWSTHASRSTSNNLFKNVNVSGNYGGRFRTAFAIGTDDGNRQCDGTVFQDCLVTGSWPDGDATLWQYGWEIGDGTHANNLDHLLYASSWVKVRYGIFMNAANVSIYGSQPGGSEVDVRISGSAAPIVIDGLRSEASKHLLIQGGGAADGHLTLRNVVWYAQQLSSDPSQDPLAGEWIHHAGGGTLLLQDVLCLRSPTGVNPVINLVTASQENKFSCIAHGVSTRSPVDVAFKLGAGAYLTIQNYHQHDANTIPIAVTPFKVLGPSIDFHIP